MEILTPLLAFTLGITTAVAFHTIYIFSSVAVYSFNADKNDKLRPLFIAIGHFLSISIIGFIVLGVGLLIENYFIYFQIPAILFIFLIGWHLLLKKKTDICKENCDCETHLAVNKLKSNDLFKSFLFGFSIGLLCIACILPIFGTIIAITAIINYQAILLLFSYVIGHTLPILIVAYIPYIAKKFIKDKPEKNILFIRKISGVILIIISFYLSWSLIINDHKDHHHNYYYEYYKN